MNGCVCTCENLAERITLVAPEEIARHPEQWVRCPCKGCGPDPVRGCRTLFHICWPFPVCEDCMEEEVPKLTLPTADHTLRPKEFYKTINISSPKAKGSKKKKKKKKKGKR